MTSFFKETVQYFRATITGFKERIVFDMSALTACALLFFLNNHVLKVLITCSAYFPGAIIWGHYNDVLGGAAFLAYTNLLLDIVRPELRIRRLPTSLAYILACGIFWELAGGFFKANATSDSLDIVAYLVGALIYWIANKAFEGESSSSAC